MGNNVIFTILFNWYNCNYETVKDAQNMVFNSILRRRPCILLCEVV